MTAPPKPDRQLVDIAALSGECRPLDGHNPFFLNEPDRAWLVIEGRVEIFAVPLGAGRPAGARRHLFTVTAGELIHAVPDLAGNGEVGLGILAVGGLGATVRLLGRPQFDDVEPECLARFVDQWIASFTDVIMPSSIIGADRIAALDDSVDLRAGERLFGHPRRLSWLVPESGGLGLLDGEQSWEMGEAIPLIGPAWVQAADAVRLTTCSTTTIIAGCRLWSGLDRFHYVAVELLARRNADLDAAAQRRFARQTAHSTQANRSAYSRLAALLVPNYRPPGVVDADEAPLLTCFRLIGDAIGATVVAPHEDIGRSDNATGISRIAVASHLNVRWTVLVDEWWNQDCGPLIGFWREGAEPVALLPRGSRRYEMVDPVSSARVIVTPSVAATLSAEAVTVYQPMPDGPMSIPQLLRFGLRGARFDLWLILGMGLSVSLLGLVMPVLTGNLFGSIIPNTERGQLISLGAGLVSIGFGSAAFQATQAIAMLRFEGRLDLRLQSAVIDRLLALPAPFFHKFTSGDLADRVLGLQTIRSILTGTTVTSVLASAFSFVSFGLLLFYSLKLAVVAAGLVAISLLVTVGLSYGGLWHERQQMRNQGHLDGLVVQLLIGIAKIRVAATEHRALAMWARLFVEQKARFIKAKHYANLLSAFEASYPVLATLVLFAVTSMILKDAVLQPPPPSPDGTPLPAPLDTGTFLAFNAAFGQLMAAMSGLATALTSALTVVPLFERSQPILTTPPERATGRNAPGELSGEIELARVTFRYAPDGPPILDSLSLHIEPGQYVAIVGPSGSGKSTIFRMLLGFEQPETGEIFFDGRPLSTLDVAAVRRQIGVVLQNGRITAGSIFSNIIGSAKLDESDAWAAARMAGLDRDIEALPMGMHTVLVDGATTLSGGQRQRLMIARALVRKPRMVLLDEATSALDNETQAIITDSLGALGTTRIVIAHRLSTITGVDRIFVIDNGRLVQSGSYAELSAVPGPFAALARRQIL